MSARSKPAPIDVDGPPPIWEPHETHQAFFARLTSWEDAQPTEPVVTEPDDPIA